MESIIKFNPAVCVVGNAYQIMVITQKEALISICVKDKIYYNHSNGIRISMPGVHRFCVPSEVLDEACEYTVVAEELTERLAYFTEPEPAKEKTYKFKPLKKKEDINIYHLADVHGYFSQAVNNAKSCGKDIDILILNGDISETSDTFDDMILCYKIASEITKGEIPCIISRGNHDLRGPGAQKLTENMPGDNGRSYYTFKAGCVWGILVDAGEDKADNASPYGGTICCHEFRTEQEEWIKKVIENAKNEYSKEDVEYRLVISHIPFTFKKSEECFDIERDLYSSWAKLIGENIKPNIMLCGHTHKACISEPGSEYDELGHPCTVVVAADMVNHSDEGYKNAGALVVLNKVQAKIIMNQENKTVLEGTVKF